MKFQSDTELAWLRTVIQMEAASGSGRCLPALREAEAILESENGHPHVGGGNPRTGAANPGPPFPPTAAIFPSLAQGPPDPKTHRIVVGYKVQADKSVRPVWEEHPVGSCANCRKGAGR